MTTTSRCLASVVAILAFGLPVIAQPQRKPSAKQILNNIFRTYARFTSYQDEGIVITTRDEETGGTIEKMPFKTFFKRPNLFRFEWTDYDISKLGRIKIVWFNGKEAFTYWEPDLFEKRESLSMAVAGATGISSRAVNTISDLVLPEELGESSLKRLKILLLGEEVIGGVPCYHIKAIEHTEPVEFWVGKNDFLLRKLRRETKVGDTLWITEEIRRKIQVDRAIPEVVFNYNPPIDFTTQKDIGIEDLDRLLDPGPPIWSEFKSEEGRFSVQLPERPSPQSTTVETTEGRFEQHLFTASHPSLSCMVGYMDIPQKLMASKAGDEFFKVVRDQFIKGLGGKLASDNSITLDGHPGREIKAYLFKGEIRLRLILVGDRLYQLSALRLNKLADEEAFNKFFASFKLNPITKPIAAIFLNPQRSQIHAVRSLR